MSRNNSPEDWLDTIRMESVRHGGHNDGEGTFLRMDKSRPNIIALNQGGFDSTEVDLLDVLDWPDKNAELVAELRRKAEG